ncbi:hypothetical protein AB0I28_00505 [Phytomonospora sp. NPDC050363]|uniref:hypothetical protein n=1 Tax=Phytomonospora sp. NPDC050363 TaxID=3155642 RepID=UPI0033F9BB0E
MDRSERETAFRLFYLAEMPALVAFVCRLDLGRFPDGLFHAQRAMLDLYHDWESATGARARLRHAVYRSWPWDGVKSSEQALWMLAENTGGASAAEDLWEAVETLGEAPAGLDELASSVPWDAGVEHWSTGDQPAWQLLSQLSLTEKAVLALPIDGFTPTEIAAVLDDDMDWTAREIRDKQRSLARRLESLLRDGDREAPATPADFDRLLLAEHRSLMARLAGTLDLAAALDAMLAPEAPDGPERRGRPLVAELAELLAALPPIVVLSRRRELTDLLGLLGRVREIFAGSVPASGTRPVTDEGALRATEVDGRLGAVNGLPWNLTCLEGDHAHQIKSELTEARMSLYRTATSYDLPVGAAPPEAEWDVVRAHLSNVYGELGDDSPMVLLDAAVNDFCGADLSSADLDEHIVRGLKGVRWSGATRWPEGWVGRLADLSTMDESGRLEVRH